MSSKIDSAYRKILNACINYDLSIPRILYRKPETKKAIVWDLDKTCDLLGSKSAGELSIEYLIANNTAMRENKNSLLEWIKKAQTKEDFSEEEKQIGELLKSAKVSRQFCEEMRTYVISNFKPAGGMIDALHEILFMNYQNFINSGSFDFVVSEVAEHIMGIYKEFTAGSFLGFDGEGYANGIFIFNIGKRKQKSEELLLQQNGFSASGLTFISHVSDDIASDAYYTKAVEDYYAKATINAGPFVWLAKEREASGNIHVVLPPETRYNVSKIPKVLRQYEFGLHVLSGRTIEREKELTHLAHKIRKNMKRIFAQNWSDVLETKKTIAKDAKNYMSDELNQQFFPAASTEVSRLEQAKDRSTINSSTQKILKILEGALEFKVEETWLDDV